MVIYLLGPNILCYKAPVYCGNINDKVLSRNLPCSSGLQGHGRSTECLTLSVRKTQTLVNFHYTQRQVTEKIRVLNFIVTYGILLGIGKK